MNPPTTAADAMALGPARAASIPPVVAPDMIEFHGSSYYVYVDLFVLFVCVFVSLCLFVCVIIHFGEREREMEKG